MEIFNIIYFVPGLLFLAIALYGLKVGKTQAPALFGGKLYGKNESNYWAIIVFYFILSFVLFVVFIAYLYLSK